MPATTHRSAVRPRKRPSVTGTSTASPSSADQGTLPNDRFFRHLVGSMRNGTIAIHRDGTLALINDEAYRIFALSRRDDDVGQRFGDLFSDRPELVRVLSGAFELTTLPNRAELRLKD